ncbi:ArsB/NhaD family transporter [Microtetraspora fusca]|uniref:ArsB/NhaD family transporter n=1 Tax=Microtetraspora fusca TaxID=1997 RepID=A0ABW6V7H7_MICFU
MAEAASIVLLLLVLAFAVVKPKGLPEVVAAAPAAVVVVLAGLVSPKVAGAEVLRLLPVVGFLAAVLALAHLCDREGLFEAAGALMARGPGGLLIRVFAVASVVTAVLSLDATVVLLTPVVLATTSRLRVHPAPHLYACTHLANTASLLLPVSNLTNLLAFTASGLSFGRFAALMALPWLAAIAVEYAVFRRFFAAELRPAERRAPAPGPGAPGVPVFAIVTVALTLAGFVVASAAGVNPAWAALGGVLVLAVRALTQGRVTARAVLRSADLPFCGFVLALGIVVRAVVDGGLGRAVRPLVPEGASLLGLLAIAAIAAVLANLFNNLPAVLVLLPITAVSGPGPVLATLIGVNVGPNLTYVGSLATLLWRRVLHAHDHEPDLGRFLRLGLLTVPPALVVAVAGLWAGLRVIGP